MKDRYLGVGYGVAFKIGTQEQKMAWGPKLIKRFPVTFWSSQQQMNNYGQSLILHQMLTYQKKDENRFFLTNLKIFYMYLVFEFSSCVSYHVTQGLRPEICKHFGKKSGFDAKVAFCYFGITS